ncbi:MAG: hypothetical protein KKA84_07655 [Bacteroidetes bacterium]|nr:hypothetical protein [Bacteroidota bacterium]
MDPKPITINDQGGIPTPDDKKKKIWRDPSLATVYPVHFVNKTDKKVFVRFLDDHVLDQKEFTVEPNNPGHPFERFLDINCVAKVDHLYELRYENEKPGNEEPAIIVDNLTD